MPSRLSRARKLRAELRSQAPKSDAVRLALAAVEAVSRRRRCTWQDLVCYDPDESKAATEAREIAVALCSAVEVPLFMVARIFSQSWAMVWEAESRTASHCLDDETIGKEWGGYLGEIRVKAPPSK